MPPPQGEAQSPSGDADQAPPDVAFAEGALRFKSIVEASPVPYAINDEAQNITYVNPAFVATFGFTREDIPTLADWWPKAYPEPRYRAWVTAEWQSRLALAHRDGVPFESFEVRIRAKDGTDRFALVSALPPGSASRGQHVVVLLDVTARKRAEDARLALERQVQHAQKLESLGVLAGGIAHDFNTLLMAILGNADLALAEVPAPGPAHESLLAIKAAARRASEVAGQMLAYAGRGKFLVAPIALSDLVAEMSQLLEVAISKKVVLRRRLGAGLPRFMGDATQLRQVVMNLITNASESIGDGAGEVTLSTGVTTCDRAFLDGATIVEDGLQGPPRAEGDYVFLEVADTGCGMTRETIRRMFEPFFTTKFTGRGLGMSASLGIVHGHRGVISIRSELGVGTTIRILFPIGAEPSVSVAGASPAPEPSARAKGTVLFVDDEPEVRKVAERMLRRLGYEVLTASGGQDAIRSFVEHRARIACVVLDLTMPDLDGGQVFRALRELCPEVKVVLTSGYTDQEVAERFGNGGLSGFLQKPFGLADLERALGAARDAGARGPTQPT